MQNLTLESMDIDSTATIARYTCDFVAVCDGSSDAEAGREVRVTGIAVIVNTYNEGDDDVYVSVNVTHDSDTEIYADAGFEDAISKALDMEVSFTEAGMQDDEYASMETYVAA
jgi:hypothetical protein